MKRIILALALAGAVTAAQAQQREPIGPSGGPPPACTQFGTAAGTCAQGNDSRITGAVQSGGAALASSALRDPTQLDDVTRGNQVGQLWLNMLTGNIWTNEVNTAAAAIWQSSYAPPIWPMDLMASPKFICGTRAWTKNWLSGNLFDVTRESDVTSTTIEAINGRPDIPKLLAFVNGTIGHVSKCYDQSGGAHDGTMQTGTITISIAAPAVITWNNHGQGAGNLLKFSTTGALPTGLTAGTTYCIIATGLTQNAFEVSTSCGGSAVATSGTQSGTQTATLTGLNGPEVRVINGQVSFVFDGQAVGGKITKSISIPSAVSWTASSISCFVVGFQQSVYNPGAPLELGTSPSNFTGVYNNGRGSGFAQFEIGNSSNQNLPTDTTRNIWWWVNTSGSGFGGEGELSVGPNAIFAAVGTPVGGTIGNSDAFTNSGTNYQWQGEIEGVGCDGTADTAAQASAVRQAIYQLYQIPPQQSDDLVVLVGGSWAWGNGSDFVGGQGGEAFGYDRQMLPLFNRPVRFVNWSTPGYSNCSASNNIQSDFASRVAPYFSANNRNNIILYDTNGNDLGSQTAAQTFACIQSNCAAFVAAGFKPIAFTIPIFPTGGFQAYAQAVNALMRGGPLACTLIDVGNDSILGNYSNLSNATYIVQSGPTAGHFTATGYSIWARGYAAPPVNAVLGVQ